MMKTTAYACLLLAALALSGCSRNTNQAAENSTLINLRGDWIYYFGLGEPEPLVVQVSEGSKSYIWQFSGKLEIPNNEAAFPFDGKNVPASALDDVQPQASLYKQTQDRQNKPVRMLIASDDDAKCGAVFEAIANAKCAGITEFYFETTYRPPGKTGTLICWEGPHLKDATRNVNLSSKSVTISIFKDNTIAWDNKPMASLDFLDRLYEIGKTIQNGNIRFIVEADAQTGCRILRYVLDQIVRATKKGYYEVVAVELRELK